MLKKYMGLWFLLILVNASVFADDTVILERTERSARTWLELIDAGKYKESWENTSPLFRSKKAEADWIRTLTTIREPRGAMTARYLATAGATKSLSDFPEGDYVVLQFYTTFANKGLALETVSLVKMPNDTWQIADLDIK